MDYPIVHVTTKGNYTLHGLLLEPEHRRAMFLHVHGTASNFYEEDYIQSLSQRLVEKGIAMLSTNNRGTGVFDAWDGKGAATELFEDCVDDIDAWIDLALKRGYSEVILAGHSLGTEKVVYYMAHGVHRGAVRALVLLAPADSNWYQRADNGEIVDPEWNARTDRIVHQAEKMIAEKKGQQFLARDSYAGVMPKTADSMINFLGRGQEIEKSLPFHLRRLEEYSKISVPILAVIGNQHEYTVIPIREALDLLRSENPKTEIHQIQNCDHDFTGHEDDLADLVLRFIETSKNDK